eukprot:PITA_13185
MEDFCGGHLFWKSTANKVLRAGYYWPTLFADVKSCHKCQIFEGRQKLQPLPLKPFEVSAPFQQWGLHFIREIHPTSSDQHRWILTAIDYLTKWIEAIPTRQATYAKLLEINKKSWHKRLVNALWADRDSQKKSIGTSPFELVYGVDTVFPTSLIAPVVKLLQEAGSEDDPMQRRKAKADKFQLDDVVLKWDARNEEKDKHGKFENLWKGPFKVAAYRGQNAFLLKEMNGEDCLGGPINGRLLKRYHF